MLLQLPWKTIGHEKQKQELERNLLSEKLFHAYLFSGPDHIGKFSLAFELAMALLCPHKLCRTCVDCRQVEALTHPDFLVIDMLYIDKKNTDWEEISQSSNISQSHRASGSGAKTDTIGIEDVRELQKKLQEKPLGKYKVCIIRNIERMKVEAMNAFLKTVEEPQKGLIFLFTSSNEASLLPTFLSRVHTLHFHLLSEEVIAQELKDHSAAKEILEYSQGRIGIAIRLAKDPEKLKNRRDFYKKIVSIYETMSLVDLFAFAEDLGENTQDVNRFFEYSYFYLRSQLHSGNHKFTFLLELLEKTQKLIEKNVNKRLALENYFLTLKSLKT